MADNTQAIIDVVRKLSEVESIKIGQTPGEDPQDIVVLSVPDAHGGRKITPVREFLEPFALAPRRRKGIASFSVLEDFIDHVKRFSDEHSVIFADLESTEPTLTSVLNYNEAKATGLPRFGDHRGVYNFPLSKEFRTWKGNAEKKMPQQAFAEFIEDNVLDVMSPIDPENPLAGAALDFQIGLGVKLASMQDLIAMSKGLSMNVESQVTNAINLSTGEIDLKFVTRMTDGQGGPMTIPGGFILAIPVFDQGKRYQIPVRLRVRKVEDKLVWWYSPHRLEKALRLACDESCDQVEDHSKLPLFHGSPERV